MQGTGRFRITDANFEHPLNASLQRESSWESVDLINDSGAAGHDKTVTKLRSPSVPAGEGTGAGTAAANYMTARGNTTPQSHPEATLAPGRTSRVPSMALSQASEQKVADDVEFCDPQVEDTSGLWSKSVRGMKLFIMSRTGFFRGHRFRFDEPAFLFGRKYCLKSAAEKEARGEASVDANLTVPPPTIISMESFGSLTHSVSGVSSNELHYQNLLGSGSFLVTPPAALTIPGLQPTLSNISSATMRTPVNLTSPVPVVTDPHARSGSTSLSQSPYVPFCHPPPTPLASAIGLPASESKALGQPNSCHHQHQHQQPQRDLDPLANPRDSEHGQELINVHSAFSRPQLGSRLPPGTYRQFRETFDSLIWMTYRKNFPTMRSPPAPPKITSDSGWGCMLRSAQMLLANTLMIHCLSHRWTELVPCCPSRPLEGEEESDDNTSKGSAVAEFNETSAFCRPRHPPLSYGKVLSLFLDQPAAPLSIHKLTEYGSAVFSRHAGEWYGPAQAATLLKFCMRNIPDEVIPNFCIVSMQSNTVYLDQIIKACSGDEVNNLEELQQWQLRAARMNRSVLADVRRHHARRERRKRVQAQTPSSASTGKAMDNAFKQPKPSANPSLSAIETKDAHLLSPAQQRLMNMISSDEDKDILSQLFSPGDDVGGDTLPDTQRMATRLPTTIAGGNEVEAPVADPSGGSDTASNTLHRTRSVKSNISVTALDENEDEVTERERLEVEAFCEAEPHSDAEVAGQIPNEIRSSHSNPLSSPDRGLERDPTKDMSGEESDREESDSGGESEAFPHRSESSDPLIKVPLRQGVHSDPASFETDTAPSQTALRWKSCLVLVPIRAGVSDTIDPKYHASILHLLQFPMSVGIMGGKPRSSLYFVGAQGTRLFYLDPHTTQETVQGSAATPEGLVHTTTCGHPKHRHKFLAAFEQDALTSASTVSSDDSDDDSSKLRGGDTYRHAPIQSIELAAVDASMTAAFYCRTYSDLCEFWRLLKRVESEPYAVISGAEKSPSLEDFQDGFDFDDDEDDQEVGKQEEKVNTSRSKRIAPHQSAQNHPAGRNVRYPSIASQTDISDENSDLPPNVATQHDTHDDHRLDPVAPAPPSVVQNSIPREGQLPKLHSDPASSFVRIASDFASEFNLDGTAQTRAVHDKQRGRRGSLRRASAGRRLDEDDEDDDFVII